MNRRIVRASIAVILGHLVGGGAGCETAAVGRCGTGGELEMLDDGSSYCVYETATPARVACPEGLVFRLQIENIVICTDVPTDSADDVPESICRLTMLSACGSGAGTDAGVDAGTDSGSPASYRIEGDPIPGVRHGSADGTEYYSSCPDGQLMAGLDGVTNAAMPGSEHVHMLTPSCRALMEDGTLAAPVAIPAIGTMCGGVSTPYEDQCGDGSVLVGVRGEIQQPCPPPGCGGDIVAELGLICAALEDWVRDGTGVVERPIQGEYLGTVIETFDERCDPGFVVTELRGTQRCAEFSIQLGCRRIAH